MNIKTAIVGALLALCALAPAAHAQAAGGAFYRNSLPATTTAIMAPSSVNGYDGTIVRNSDAPINEPAIAFPEGGSPNWDMSGPDTTGALAFVGGVPSGVPNLNSFVNGVQNQFQNQSQNQFNNITGGINNQISNFTDTVSSVQDTISDVSNDISDVGSGISDVLGGF